MHPLLLETPLYALCDRYRLNMTAFVLFLDHLDHALDLIEYGLALRRNILRGLFRACRGDAPGIVNAKADLFEDEGKDVMALAILWISTSVFAISTPTALSTRESRKPAPATSMIEGSPTLLRLTRQRSEHHTICQVLCRTLT